jgi:hypothetical protein
VSRTLSRPLFVLLAAYTPFAAGQLNLGSVIDDKAKSLADTKTAAPAAPAAPKLPEANSSGDTPTLPGAAKMPGVEDSALTDSLKQKLTGKDKKIGNLSSQLDSTKSENLQLREMVKNLQALAVSNRLDGFYRICR